MKNKINSIVILFMLLISMAFSQYQISNSVIGSGGNKTSNANYIYNSTVGEPFIGTSVSAANQHRIGFWYVYQQQTITDVEDDETIPIEFKLEQNYPNPFNPSTIIKYAVPEKSNVLLKIYDILGNEVATLVDEYKPAGMYNVQFTINNLASGIYFYQLKTGDYIQTKKMMYLK